MRASWFEWRHASLADRTYCRALIKEGSRSFHAASLLLPKRLRDPAYAVYAFCRIADDAVDNEDAHIEATDRLRCRLDKAYQDKPEDNPCDRALADVVWQYDIPKPLFEALIEGLDWDQDGRSYETIECLHAYAARVASAVGSIMACLMGRKAPETVARACDLGVAMQLTNIARDVGEDARNGRVYLPHAWLRDVGIDPEDLIANPQMTPELASVIQRLLNHADILYRQSLIGIGQLPRNCRPSINAARRIYAAIGDEIAANGYDAINHRAYVSTPRKVWIALIASAECMLPCGKDSELEINETEFLVAAVSDHVQARNPDLANAANRIEWIITLLDELDKRQRERNAQVT